MFFLGIDVGSSSVKASLLDGTTGTCVASDFFPKCEAPIKAIQPGWAEQNPEDWWQYLVQATHSVLASAKREAHVAKEDVKAIGISWQMHGLVCVDKNQKVLRDAIIWCDSRAVPYGDRAFEALGKEYCLGHILNSPGNFTASKLAWVKEHEPETYGRIDRIMLPGDYIAMRLTDSISTTVEGLSEAMLWDFQSNSLATDVLDYFGFPHDIIPPLVPTFGEQGRVSRQAAEILGLKEGIPVTYRAGDQPNNALSLNVLEPGEVASTAGTSGVVYGVSDNIGCDPLSRVNCFAHVNHEADKPRLGVLLCINGTGILNSWLKHNVAPELSYQQMNDLAAGVPVGSEGLSILPFGNGAERMLQNRELGCNIHGLSFNNHTRAHLIRAAQEGIVFAFRYGVDIMKEMGLSTQTIRAGYGNMFLSDIFSSTLASICDAEIQLFDTDGSLGAARGAGIGLGEYRSPKEAFSTLHCIKQIHPDEKNRRSYSEAYDRWFSYINR